MQQTRKSKSRCILLFHPSMANMCPEPDGNGDNFEIQKIEIDASTKDESWLNQACDKIQNETKNGTDASVVLLPEIDNPKSAILSLVSSGADDVISIKSPNPRNIAVHSVSRIQRVLEFAERISSEGGLMGSSPAMRKVRKQLALALMNPNSSVLLYGETGTGKCLAARVLHSLDMNRKPYPFHILDCGAINDGLFGSELFGHVAGAFTGAQSNRPGALHSAGKGVLLLDEIGELSRSLQTVFLTALQEKKFRPVGSDHDRLIECRIISATNRDLLSFAQKDHFRKDLFYRIAHVCIEIPPLRERRCDIPILFTRFVQLDGSGSVAVEPEVLEHISRQPLFGNVRELQAISWHCLAASNGAKTIRLPHLPLMELARKQPTHRLPLEPLIPQMIHSGMTLDQMVAQFKTQIAKEALQIAELSNPFAPKGDLKAYAARLLNISPRTLYNIIPSNESPENLFL